MREDTAHQIANEIEARFPHIHACVVNTERTEHNWLVGLFDEESNDSLNVVIDSPFEYHYYLCAYRAFAGLPNEMLPVEAQIEKTYLEEIAAWTKKEV